MTVKNGPLPKGWREVKLKEVANLRNGKYRPSESQPVRCIELEHLEKNSGRIIGEIDARTQNSTKNIFKAGDVLFGKLRPYLRKFGLPKFNGVCSSEIWVFVSNTDLITNKYLFFSLQTEYFINSACKTTGTKMPRADWNFVQNVPVALPPLSEQKAIASLLEKWDIAIEKIEALIEAKEKRFKWLLKTLISDQQDNPEWQKVKLGEILQESQELDTTNDPTKRLTVRLHLKGVGVREHRGTESENATYYFKRKAGQLIYGKQNIFRGAIGIIPSHLDGYSSSRDIPAFDVSSRVSVDWLYLFLSRSSFYKSLERLSAGSGSKRLHPMELYKIVILLPPILHQKQVARIFDIAQQEIDLLKQLAEQCRTQKRGLMQKLMTGKWRIRNQNRRGK